MRHVGRIWPGVFALAIILGFYLLPGIVPSVVMSRILTYFTAQTEGYNRALVVRQLADYDNRNFVRPSPDLLYAACPYSLSNGAVEVSTPIFRENYWSMAFYASNTDNYYVLSDESLQTASANVRIVYSRKGAAEEPPVSVEEGYVVVRSPSRKGLVLVRIAVLKEQLPEQLDKMSQFDCRQIDAPAAGSPAASSR